VVERRALQDQCRVAAAELEHHLLEVGAGPRADRRPGALAPGQSHPAYPEVVDQSRDLLDAAEEVRVGAPGCACLLEEPREGECALRHVLGVLDHDHVAGHELWRGDTDHLVEGEVPGLDGQDDADGLRDQRRTRLAGECLLGEQPLPVHGVVLQDVGDQIDLEVAEALDLAHLEHRQRRVLVVPLPEDLRGTAHDLRSFGDRPQAPVLAVRPVRDRQSLEDLGVRLQGELAHELSGRWVDGAEAHGSSLVRWDSTR
jgi:hypothetical protein